MPRKQTRRAVSLKPETYDKMRAWCDTYKISMSSFVEERVKDFFDGTPRTAKSVQEAEGEWTPQYPEPPKPPDMYPGTDIRRPQASPAGQKPIRGGGVHEL